MPLSLSYDTMENQIKYVVNFFSKKPNSVQTIEYLNIPLKPKLCHKL